MTSLGDKVCLEVIKLNEVISVGIIQYDWYPYKKGKQTLRQTHMGEDDMKRQEREFGQLQDKERASSRFPRGLQKEPILLTSWFQTSNPELQDNKISVV